MEELTKLLDSLGQSSETFEDLFYRFTTGDENVSVKMLDGAYKIMKNDCKPLRRISKDKMNADDRMCAR